MDIFHRYSKIFQRYNKISRNNKPPWVNNTLFMQMLLPCLLSNKAPENKKIGFLLFKPNLADIPKKLSNTKMPVLS